MSPSAWINAILLTSAIYLAAGLLVLFLRSL